jgi:hypothetical protein
MKAFKSPHGKLFDSTDFAFFSELQRLSSQSSRLPCLKPAFTRQLHRVGMEKRTEPKLKAMDTVGISDIWISLLLPIYFELLLIR